jgi:hypothetical protein
MAFNNTSLADRAGALSRGYDANGFRMVSWWSIT